MEERSAGVRSPDRVLHLADDNSHSSSSPDWIEGAFALQSKRRFPVRRRRSVLRSSDEPAHEWLGGLRALEVGNGSFAFPH